MKLNTSKQTWDLDKFYKSETDPKIKKDMEVVKKINYQFINKWKDRKDYLKDPKALKQALEESEIIDEKYGVDGNFGYYFSLKSALNQIDPKLKARENKIEEYSTKIVNDGQFFGINLSKIPLKDQKVLLNSPELSKYRFYLQRIFEFGKHTLSDKEERILNLKSPLCHSNWSRMLNSLLNKQEDLVLDEKGKKTRKNFNEILGLTSDQNKKVRDTSAKSINKIFSSLIDVAENEINSILQNKKINDELRGYIRPDSSRHLSDNIETEVVNTLVKEVTADFNTAKKFYELKAKLFKVKKLAYHERNLEYGKIVKKYPYERAVNLVAETFKSLDLDFFKIFKTFVEGGQVDVLPKKGKSGGAFCAHNLISQPTFILLNHTNRLNDVLTLAHEVGHGINNELMRKKQPPVYFGSPTSTAEVASTFMEDFVLQALIEKSNKEERLSIIMQKLNDDISSIHRQIAFYNFETELHNLFRKQGYLSHQKIGQIFQKHMVSYMGQSVSQDKGSENWWVYVGHFRRFFYVYSYSSGLLISKALQNMVKKDIKNISKVKDFLASGSSDSPKNLFLKMGIDIGKKEFWKAGLKEVSSLLDEAEILAKELGKI